MAQQLKWLDLKGSFSAVAPLAIVLSLILPMQFLRAIETDDTSLRVIIEADRQIYKEGESIVVRARIENVGHTTKVILSPIRTDMILEKSSNLSLALVSSTEAVTSRRVTKSSRYEAAQTVLLPGGSWGINVDLVQLFGKLMPDTYTVFVIYQASEASFIRQAELVGVDKWVGRSRSNHLTFTLIALDQLGTIKKYRELWLSAPDLQKKLRALWWLKDNILKKGMTQEQVEEVLGQPTMARDNNNEWVYTVGRTGLIITFEQGKIRSLSAFET